MFKSMLNFSVLFRTLVVTVFVAIVISFLLRLFFPQITNPVAENEMMLSNIVGILVWVIAGVIGIGNGYRYSKRLEKQKDEATLL